MMFDKLYNVIVVLNKKYVVHITVSSPTVYVLFIFVTLERILIFDYSSHRFEKFSHKLIWFHCVIF